MPGRRAAPESGKQNMPATVLVVEDEPDNRLLIGMVLRGEGYEVVEAEDGVVGLARAREIHPDLVLLDVMMPGLNGFEVHERLQADPELRRIPVVMLTALAQRTEVERAVRHGVQGYVTKPFEPADLLAAVSAHVGQRK